MTLFKPLWMGAATGDAPVQYSMREMRGLVSALVQGEGVCGLGDFKVTARSGGANRSVDIAGGWSIIQGDTQAGQNKYVQGSDAGENRTGPAAPGSGTRHHLVYQQVRDRKEDNGANYDQILSILTDTTGTRPPLPQNAIPLAELVDTPTTVAFSAANGNIIDLRPFAVAINGVSDYKGVKSGTTDSGGFITITHGLGRTPVGAVATFSHPAPASGTQATHVTVNLTTATATTIRAQVWWPSPFFVWANKPVTFSYILW